MSGKTGEVVEITGSVSESDMSDRGGGILEWWGVVVESESDLERERPRDEGLREETIESRSFWE